METAALVTSIFSLILVGLLIWKLKSLFKKEEKAFDVYLNGLLMREGDNGDPGDYYLDEEEPVFEFKLKGGFGRVSDIITLKERPKSRTIHLLARESEEGGWLEKVSDKVN